MANSSRKMVTCAVGLMVLVSISAGFAGAAVTCGDIFQDAMPCQPFVMGPDPKPSDACCGGLQKIDNEAAASKEDLKAVCECMKKAAQTFPIKQDKANQLPELCHLKTKIKFDPNADCNAL